MFNLFGTGPKVIFVISDERRLVKSGSELTVECKRKDSLNQFHWEFCDCIPVEVNVLLQYLEDKISGPCLGSYKKYRLVKQERPSYDPTRYMLERMTQNAMGEPYFKTVCSFNGAGERVTGPTVISNTYDKYVSIIGKMVIAKYKASRKCLSRKYS